MKILVALDATEEAREVLVSASNVCLNSKPEYHLLSVVRPLTYRFSAADGLTAGEFMKKCEPELRAQITGALETYARDARVKPASINVKFGRPANEIKRLASELDVDLIVVGTHSHKRLAPLLGSTANSVLHGAPCDTLIVNVNTTK